MPDQPLIAIDVVPVHFSAVEWLQVATAIRANEPYAGRRALPGVLLGTGELLADAALRALSTKAGIEGSEVRHLMQLGAFDRPGRDPRSQAISVAFLAVIEPASGPEVEWSPADMRERDLPFDHDDIVDEALAAMRARLWRDRELTRALTGTVFPTTTASALQEQLNGVRPRRSTLHRDLGSNKALERLETSATTQRGRPATMWRWL